jgi:hypothetical protein
MSTKKFQLADDYAISREDEEALSTFIDEDIDLGDLVKISDEVGLLLTPVAMDDDNVYIAVTSYEDPVDEDSNEDPEYEDEDEGDQEDDEEESFDDGIEEEDADEDMDDEDDDEDLSEDRV